jgi:hypothetical protein
MPNLEKQEAMLYSIPGGIDQQISLGSTAEEQGEKK